jgi:hypothetical protein
VEFDLIGLPDDMVHASVFDGEYTGMLELDPVAQADAVFGHGLFIWMLHMDALVLVVKSVIIQYC